MERKLPEKRKLTDKGIAALQAAPAGKRVLLYDTIVSGLAVMVTDRGSKSFVFVGRFPAKRRDETGRRVDGFKPGSGKATRRFLGRVDDLSLADARVIAEQWRGLLAKRVDPAQHEAAKREAEQQRWNDLFEDVAKAFVAGWVRGRERKKGVMRTADDAEYIVNRHLIPRWGRKPITDITPRDVRALCDDFAKAGTVAHGRNVFSVCRRLFGWAVDKGIYGLDRSPCEGLKPAALIGEVQARKRVLSDDELRAFWKATDRLGYPYRDLLRLALLFGSRRDEIGGAQHPEFDLEQGTLTVPAERFKSDRVHLVPLSGYALEIVRGLPRHKGPFVFTTTDGKKPVAGFGKIKAKLDGLMQGMLGEAELEPWTIHDLRRTCRTRMSELRIAPHVAEAVLGHSIPGVNGIYDRYDYFEEKREALQKWADHLLKIVTPRPVVQPDHAALLTAAE